MRVVIAEDQALLRDGLARLFRDGGHHVAATLRDADDLLATIEHERPDLALVDIRMPPTYTDEGARAARTIKEHHPDVGVLLLSQHIETAHVVNLITHPGFGYLLKDRVLEVGEFLTTAERVAAGGSALDPVIVANLVAPTNRGPIGRLSEREHDVLELMAQGLANTAIARRLVISERTVEAHIRHILTKLDISDTNDSHRRVLAVLTYLNPEHNT
jgi:DNA-binding NarL/FixJ family response regulator